MSNVEPLAGVEPVRALEPRYYLDPEIYGKEREAIFFRTWQYAGHVSQVQRAGDYFTFSVLDQDLFCIRNRDGEIKTFYNVCQHRAHELVEGSGTKRTIVCPYHAWTYDLDGHLRKAPGDNRTPGFDRSEICLTPVRTEIFCGFIFVNLDDDAAPMEQWFPGAEKELRAYVPQIDSLQPIHWVEAHERCNWKISVENYSECYHCELVHKTFATGVIDPESYNIRPQGHCLRHTTKSVNIDKLTYEIDAEANEHALDYSSWFLWPCFSFQVYPGNTLNTYLWRPRGVDEVDVYRGWYSVDGVDSLDIKTLAQQDLDTTVSEDIRLVESVQRGLASRGYRAGPLIIDPNEGLRSEHSIRALHAWTREAVDG